MCSRCGNNRCKSCVPSKVENISKTYTVPVPGKDGDKGDRYVEVYRLSDSGSVIPTIQNVVSPPGWTTNRLAPTDDQPFRWTSFAYVKADGSELVQGWSTPVVDSELEDIVPQSSSDIFDF